MKYILTFSINDIPPACINLPSLRSPAATSKLIFNALSGRQFNRILDAIDAIKFSYTEVEARKIDLISMGANMHLQDYDYRFDIAILKTNVTISIQQQAFGQAP